jgi:two-component system chemotaxis response regulator CheB
MSNLPVSAQFRIVIVQHMPEGFTERFARRLNSVSEYEVREAKDGEILRKGLALVAPGDYHLIIHEVNKEIVARLSRDKPINGVRPSVEPTLISASRVCGSNTIAVILTGMGKDGQIGVQFVRKAGGKVIAQSKRTCVVYGMPKRAIETGCVDVVADACDIADEILKLAGAS